MNPIRLIVTQEGMTDFILEPAREVPVVHHTDVLVGRSDPGELAAALAQLHKTLTDQGVRIH